MTAPSEAQLHRAVADFLAVALPADAVWTTVEPAGQGERRGAILRGRGVRAGWPDVQVIHRGKVYLIELKSARGHLSPAQRETHMLLAGAGATVAVCRSVAEVAEVLGRAFALRARPT